MDWFPRMRAMSLVSSDGDGEQNEIRNLQEKLESTMKLVSNLSGQLTELKEQVGRPPGSFRRTAFRTGSTAEDLFFFFHPQWTLEVLIFHQELFGKNLPV